MADDGTRRDEVIRYDRSVPSFLQETPEAAAWFEELAQQLRSKHCDREEIAWLLSVQPTNVCEAIPSSCSADFKGTMLSEMKFVSRGSGCIIKGVAGKAFLNGRKAVLCRDLHLNCQYAVLLVDGGTQEQVGAGDISKTLEISRQNLMLEAPVQECTLENGWPSLDLLPASKLAALDARGADASRPSAGASPQELLGTGVVEALPQHLHSAAAQLWLAGVVGRLVDSRRCCSEELAVLFGVLEATGDVPAGFGGPHVRPWPDPKLIGSVLSEVGFVPSYSVVMVQDTENEELNGRLGEVLEPCHGSKSDVRLWMAHDGQDVALPREHLRLLPSPVSAMKLGLIPFGTRCVVEGSSSRQDLNGQRVMLLEDCSAGLPHCRVFGEGLGELRIHRRNLRVASPDPEAAAVASASFEDVRASLQRCNRTTTIGSMESREEQPAQRRPIQASIIGSELGGAEAPGAVEMTASTSKGGDAAETSTGSEATVEVLGDVVAEGHDTPQEKQPDESTDAKRSAAPHKGQAIDDGRKCSLKAQQPDASTDAKRSDAPDAGEAIDDGRRCSLKEQLAEDTDQPSTKCQDEASNDLGGASDPAGWMSGLWNMLSFSSGPACGMTCCRKDITKELNLDAADPRPYLMTVGEDPELDHVHSSLAPAAPGALVISMGVADVAPAEYAEGAGGTPKATQAERLNDSIRKEASAGGASSPESNAPTREPASGVAAVDALSSATLAPVGGPDGGVPTEVAGGGQPDAPGDTEAAPPRPKDPPTAKKKGLLSRVLPRRR